MLMVNFKRCVMSETEDRPQEDLDLEYALELRKKLINLTFAGDKLPESKTDVMVLLDSLGAIEKVSISKKRIISNDEKSKQTGALAVELAKLLRNNVKQDNSSEMILGSIPEFPEEVLESIVIEDFEKSEYREQSYQEFKVKQGLD